MSLIWLYEERERKTSVLVVESWSAVSREGEIAETDLERMDSVFYSIQRTTLLASAGRKTRWEQPLFFIGIGSGQAMCGPEN